MERKNIVILYSDAKREFFLTNDLYLTEKEVYPRCKIIKPFIEKLGYKVTLLPGNMDSMKKIKNMNPYMVINLVDSLYGKEELAPVIPSLLELLKVPYTGTESAGLTINANKHLTKSILKQNGLLVPDFQIFYHPEDKLDKKFEFPLIVKLNRFHGSVEMSEKSVVENPRQLKKRVTYLITKYKQEVMVEKYIKGKEITVLIIDGKDNLALAEERIFITDKKYNLFGFKEAWSPEEYYDVKKFELNFSIKKQILKAFKVLKILDYARFEIIIDKSGKYYFIDLNANPSVGPKVAGEAFGYMLYINNITFENAMNRIIINARERFAKYSALDK